MSLPPDQAWFPAKRYGWGWGLPIRRGGWIVLVAYLLLLTGVAAFFGRERNPSLFLALVAMLSAGLVLVCWWKGEKPRWRWGRD
ncbi:MAG: hypothetical protein WCQ89_03425 [Verrucomicrobiota bacterium]|jgi:hypothetical protein